MTQRLESIGSITGFGNLFYDPYRSSGILTTSDKLLSSGQLVFRTHVFTMDTKRNCFALAGFTTETILISSLAGKPVRLDRDIIEEGFELVELPCEQFEVLDTTAEALYVDDSGYLFEVNIPEQGSDRWHAKYQVILCALTQLEARIFRKVRKTV